MKILRICGKNLASLAGEFEVDFQQAPLVSAGLFAICGPTGAGKSTLLDALCLALYDATPRLARASSKGIGLPDVHEEVVTPQDTRTLLRRGAAEGYAEVDFIGNDGSAYRSRWSVRRARSKADGALQQIGMSLLQLPGLQAIGGTNREVKSEIEQRIGLSFEQFTRAVLLAQNEFSAFLKSDDGERGELLETLTGTAIYTDISRRAYERAKDEQLALRQLNLRLADQKPLSREERAQLDEDSRRAGKEVAALEQRKSLLEEHLRWHQTLRAAREAEERARAERDRLAADRQAATPRRAHFTLVESIQPGRAFMAEHERAAADIAQSRSTIAVAEAELANADTARQNADDALASARRALHDAERAQADAAPMLDSAKALDAQIETLAPTHQQAARRQADAHAAEARAQQALRQNQEQRALALKDQQTAIAWLAQHAQLQALADGWPRWDMLLAQAAHGDQDRTRAQQALAGAQHDEACKRSLDADAGARLAASQATLTAAETMRAQSVAHLAAFDVPALLECKQMAEARRDMLIEGERLWRNLAGNLLSQSELDAKTRQAQDAIEQAETALARINAAIPDANAALAQAERSLKTAEAACAESVESLRAALEPGAPCPVCGALDHPYVIDNPQLRAMLDALQAEVRRCREQAQQLLQQQATQMALAAGGREQQSAIAEQSRKLIDSTRIATDAWNAHPVRTELAGIGAGERAIWFADQQEALRTTFAAIGNEEQAARKAAQDRDKAQEEFDAASGQHATCKDAAVAAKSNLAQAVSERTAAAEKHADTARRLDATLADLGAAFPDQDWMQAWRAAPEAFHAKRKSEVEQWHAHSEARDECQIRIGKLDAAHQALADTLDKAGDEVRRATEAFAVVTSEIEEKQSARRTLFDGNPVNRIETDLVAAIEAAKARLAAQTELAQQSTAAHTRCSEALNQARRRLDAQQLVAESAAAKLASWLRDFNLTQPVALDIEQLRALLAHSLDWIIEERRQLQELDSTLQNANTVLQERQMQREAHESRCPTEDAVEAVEAALDKLTAERQSATTQATALQLALVHDDARRQQSAAMIAEIEKQERVTQVWAQLSELIGSADGKKFRNYAQQFTLDVLLGYANRHLSELSRRYQLERIRDTLALMVIDRDMGEEIRSVHSLSGGESFLVSLALALGLASLSSNRVRVESLFIDEGFGSLDADTLSIAMDALDGLQSMGRKVGVISHVQEMTERIATKILVQRTAGGKSRLSISGL